MRLPVSYLKGNAPDDGRRAQRRKCVIATTKMGAISRQEKGKKKYRSINVFLEDNAFKASSLYK